MKFDLQGVMVTGAGGGLGRAVALGLARHGVRTICLDSNGEALEQTAAALEQYGVAHRCVVADLALEASIAQAFAEIESDGLPLDRIVKCC